MPLEQKNGSRKSRKHETFTHQSTTQWVKKQNDGILKFTCKWMEPENTILSEVTQTQKDEYGIYSLINGYQPKTKNIEFMILEKLSNKVHPKKTYINPPEKSKQTRSSDKIGNIEVGGVESVGL